MTDPTLAQPLSLTWDPKWQARLNGLTNSIFVPDARVIIGDVVEYLLLNKLRWEGPPTPNWLLEEVKREWNTTLSDHKLLLIIREVVIKYIHS